MPISTSLHSTGSSSSSSSLDGPNEFEAATVVVVDDRDCVVGSANLEEKTSAAAAYNHSVFHRSVALFVVCKDKLLLAKNNAGLWTSTVVAIPWPGQIPSEVDSDEQIRNGQVEGLKNALIRQCKNNRNNKMNNLSSVLFSTPSSSSSSSSRMKFITRVQADATMHSVFLVRIDHESDIAKDANNDDDDDDNAASSDDNNTNQSSATAAATTTTVKWVSRTELEQLLQDPTQKVSSQLKWTYSALIAAQNNNNNNIVRQSWDSTSFDSDYTTILHPQKRMSVNNDAATTVATAGDESKKQGAYGKIKTHKESKLSQLAHITEVWSALQFLYLTPLHSNMIIDSPDLEFCEEILVAVSRSFASVIRQLPANIGIDVAIFYLVLRALDTVEDDTVAFSSHEEKVRHLLAFTTNALENPTWSMDGVGHGDERRLLQEFPKVHRVYAQLPEGSQTIITDITLRMATGMAEFVTKDLGQGTKNIDEYNRYCHFVAGLVGEGLSRLFSASSLEHESLGRELRLSDQMGLFLQKTNILRDFLEDYVDQRAFWPQSVWKKYSPTGDLGYFCDQDDDTVRRNALACLNELVADALELVPDCLEYMARLQCTEVFRFCAIPQVMAIATLAKIYNNPDVFTGVVKIRKGLSCQLILSTNNLAELHETFYDFSHRILQETKVCVGSASPNYIRTVKACESVLELTRQKSLLQKRARMVRTWTGLAVLLVAFLWQFVPLASLLETTMTSDQTKSIRALIVVVASIVYFGIGPWTVPSNLKTADLLNGRTVV